MVTHPARILLAAGGTGGHVYPAVAVAESLRRIDPEIEVCFCCGNRPAELRIYRKLGIEPWVIPVSYHRPGLLNRARFLWEMIRGLLAARRLVRRFPVDVVMGFGSFVSIPPVLAAHFSGAVVLLHESNIHAGAANRFLRRFSRQVAVAHPALEAVFGSKSMVCTGNPIRESIMVPIDPAVARREFDLEPGQRVCLCVGGSQGSRELNTLLMNTLGENMGSQDTGWRFLWATGPEHYELVMNELKRMNISTAGHCIVPYLDNIAAAYSVCDLVLARGGAVTQSEITARGLPAVLTPLRTRDDHQLMNVRWLEDSGAAVVLGNMADPSTRNRFRDLLDEWCISPEKLRSMGEASRKTGHPNAAFTLARMLISSLSR